MDKKIVEICGNSDVTPDFEMIGNDPNFVFTPDPNFSVVTLYDSAGNLINVNSWLECANYVNGSWTNNVSDFYDGEKFIFSLLLVFIASLYLFGRSKYAKLWSELS